MPQSPRPVPHGPLFALLVAPPGDVRCDPGKGLDPSCGLIVARTALDAPDAVVGTVEVDLALIDAPAIDDMVLSAIRLLYETHALSVGVLVAQADVPALTEALAAGAASVQTAEDRAAVLPGLMVTAYAQCRQRQGLLDELNAARPALADRKAVDRAKGLVMAQLGCTEPEAYARIRKLAMDRNMRIGEAAEHLAMALENLRKR